MFTTATLPRSSNGSSDNLAEQECLKTILLRESGSLSTFSEKHLPNVIYKREEGR